MRLIKRVGASIILAGLLAGSAWADRPYHHPRSSVTLGVYLGDPWPYYSPYYYPYPVYAPRVYVPPAPVVITQTPPVYVEQPRPAAPTLESGYWYYCADSQTYYPYVKQCASPWQRVAPQPAQ